MTDTLTLFVYGSLRPGLPLWSWLEPIALEVRDNATTKGALWMTVDGSYPWLTKGDDTVVGTLVSVPVGETLKFLINMEIGAGYRFEPIEVDAGVEQGLAMAFVYPGVREDFIKVPGQDWSEWVAQVPRREWRG